LILTKPFKGGLGKYICARQPNRQEAWIHQSQSASGASGSITMVMVIVRSFVLFVRIFNLKGLILIYYKVNWCYFSIHLGLHHTGCLFGAITVLPWCNKESASSHKVFITTKPAVTVSAD
jgi:hypothetical protein